MIGVRGAVNSSSAFFMVVCRFALGTVAAIRSRLARNNGINPPGQPGFRGRLGFRLWPRFHGGDDQPAGSQQRLHRFAHFTADVEQHPQDHEQDQAADADSDAAAGQAAERLQSHRSAGVVFHRQVIQRLGIGT